MSKNNRTQGTDDLVTIPDSTRRGSCRGSRNVPMTTFLKVASEALPSHEVFGKEHKHVMEAIRNLIDKGLPNFRPSSYVNSQNKQQPMFLMDRKGFVLLVMGFTGDAALEFKIKYIEEFNRMETEHSATKAFRLPSR